MGLLGWGVTIFSGLMSYPIDTVRRRMMMTSGSAVKYKGSMDCAVQVIKGEGFMSLMKGAVPMSSVVSLVPVYWLVSTNLVQYTWHGDWDNNFRSLTSVTQLKYPPKSLYKSNLRKNVFGLKPGGLLSLFTSTSNRETQSHKKKYHLTWPLLASFGPQTSKEKRSSQQTTSTV